MPIESYKPLGLISILLTWAGLIFLIRKWPGSKSMTFSQHAAASRSSKLFYAILFSLTLPLLYMFVVKWFIPAFEMGSVFLAFVVIAITGQLIAVWVPETVGVKKTVHYVGAYMMHTLLIPLTVLILFSAVSAPAKTVAVVALTAMIAVWSMHFSKESVRKRALHFQSAYVAAFHLTILASTYLR